MDWIIFEISTGFILSYQSSEPTTEAGEDKAQVTESFLRFSDLDYWKWDGINAVKCTEEETALRKEGEYYEIQDDIDDSIKDKDFRNINYKTELKSGISYTPVFIIHDQGEFAGLINKTEYYRNFVDENNKGTLVLVVEEVYTIDNSDVTIPNTARPTTERTKTWKHVVKSSGTPQSDVNKQKTKSKKYDTRRKRHKEGNRRRENIIEQLIDNIGLAGLLSGTFADVNEAHDSLTALQELHAASFSGWLNSGRGSLVDVIQNDATTTWLDSTVLDNASTQAMCSWMIGLTFRAYIQDKLKGNIK